MKVDQILPPYESTSAFLQSQTNPLHRILVVEDDIAIRRLNTEMLKRSGYEVEAAEDGAAAWEALNADSYDLLITDNVMPKATGVELLKQLRAARMDLPVIMATGTLPKHEFARFPWIQPTATLLKPYTAAELLRTVKKVLREADGSSCTPRQGPANSPHYILAVDEDSDLRRLYADALAGPDYRVDVAEDGAAGWEALQANRYNLLITEHDLPKLTGIELVRKLRAARMVLPVVMASGRLPTYQLTYNPPLQLAAMLVKPFAVDALLATVSNVLRATDSPRERTDPLPNRQSQPSAIGWRLR